MLIEISNHYNRKLDHKLIQKIIIFLIKIIKISNKIFLFNKETFIINSLCHNQCKIILIYLIQQFKISLKKSTITNNRIY